MTVRKTRKHWSNFCMESIKWNKWEKTLTKNSFLLWMRVTYMENKILISVWISQRHRRYDPWWPWGACSYCSGFRNQPAKIRRSHVSLDVDVLDVLACVNDGHSYKCFDLIAGWLSLSASMTFLSLATVPGNSSSSPAVTVWSLLLWVTAGQQSAGCSLQSRRASPLVWCSGSPPTLRWSSQRYVCLLCAFSCVCM